MKMMFSIFMVLVVTFAFGLAYADEMPSPLAFGKDPAGDFYGVGLAAPTHEVGIAGVKGEASEALREQIRDEIFYGKVSADDFYGIGLAASTIHEAMAGTKGVAGGGIREEKVNWSDRVLENLFSSEQ